MIDVLLGLLAFTLGFGGIMGYQYLQMKQKVSPIAVPITSSQPAPEPTFALVPPSEALSGTLSVTSGQAEKLSREDSEYKEASNGARVLLGESVVTKAYSSAKIQVPGFVSASMGPVAELVFVNMFPANFVVVQKSGRIDYLVTKPISIRALHTLISILPGETVVTIVGTDMSISVKAGLVTFALVDGDNNTNVWHLSSGERANIDDEARAVYLVRTR